MNNRNREVVTVRPEVTISTKQQLPNFVGVSESTAGAKGISMNLVKIPPAAKARPHYHEGYETAVYILKGTVITHWGEHLEKSKIHREGDFLFIPPGVPHYPENCSATEEALAIVARNDPNEQESVHVYDV